MWTDTEAGGDIWNGRWSPDLLSTLLGTAAQDIVDQRLFKRALQRIQAITHLLQQAQRAIYRVRYIELSSKEVKQRRDSIISLRRKRATIPSRTLFAVWNIPYCRPALPKRRWQHHAFPADNPPPPQQTELAQSGAWRQYTKPWSSSATLAYSTATARCKQDRNQRRHKANKTLNYKNYDTY
jgi:hypothetical protein